MAETLKPQDAAKASAIIFEAFTDMPPRPEFSKDSSYLRTAEFILKVTLKMESHLFPKTNINASVRIRFTTGNERVVEGLRVAPCNSTECVLAKLLF